MPDPSDPATGELLEFLEWMGMDEEADGLRADLGQLDCARRVVRICRLAGFPISKDGSPGIVITRVHELDTASQAYLGTGVTVSWQVSAELDGASETALPGEESDLLAQTIAASMNTMLAAVLQRGGCGTVMDSLQGDLVVRVVSFPEHTDALYRDRSDQQANVEEQ